jgi:hypothetical protein
MGDVVKAADQVMEKALNSGVFAYVKDEKVVKIEPALMRRSASKERRWHCVGRCGMM